MRDSVLFTVLHFGKCSVVAVGQKARKSEAMSAWFNDLAMNDTLEDVHLAIGTVTESGHTDGSGTLVVPVLHHSVDSGWTDCFDEPLDIWSGKTIY